MGVTPINQPGKHVDLSQIDPERLLLEYNTEQALYDTAAFDEPGKYIRLFPRGFTIWSGFPGAGKTTLIRQTVCHLLQCKRAIALASFEEHYKAVIIRLAATAAGTEFPTANHVNGFLSEYGNQLFVWEEEGPASHRRVLQWIRDLAMGEGIAHAFLDSLMCLDVANDDFEQQRRIANQIAVTARSTKTHIHLVAHPRKLVSSNQEPDINDVAGAREIGGLADNVLFVRKLDDKTSYISGRDATPMGVSIRKQRHFDGGLGDVSGWFNRRHKQFHAEQFSAPTRYLPDWAYE